QQANIICFLKTQCYLKTQSKTSKADRCYGSINTKFKMSKPIKVGSDFSGVGAFNQALIRLGINYEEIHACDMDKYARKTFIHNYGEPKYYPLNVYDREIPKEPLDIFMTSPPC